MGLETTWPSVGCCRVRPISTQGHKKFSQTTTEKTWFLQQLFLQKHLFLARSINRYSLPSTTAQMCKILPHAAGPTRCPSVSPRPCHPAPLCSERTAQEGKEEVPSLGHAQVMCHVPLLQLGKRSCRKAKEHARGHTAHQWQSRDPAAHSWAAAVTMTQTRPACNTAVITQFGGSFPQAS